MNKTNIPWGWSTSINLRDCEGLMIRHEGAIRKFVVDLCELIDMKRYGECHIVHFGEDPEVAGYSMFQLIETSNISAHFVNKTDDVYLDIFSCKYYDPIVVAEFAELFFGAESYTMNTFERQA